MRIYRADILPIRLIKIIVVVLGICIFNATLVFAQRGGGPGGGGGMMPGGSGRNADQWNARAKNKPPAHFYLTPHGGQYLTTKSNYYEIVYLPSQVRIYLLDNNIKPLSARDVHVQILLDIPDEEVTRKLTLKYAAQPPDSTEQDYVAAEIDLNQMPDEEMPIKVVFSGLADQELGTGSFTPIFSRSMIRQYVVQALVMDADRAVISRQKTCPVNGQALGSRGEVIKLYAGETHLFVCCKECFEAVKRSPTKYLPKPKE